MMNHRRMCIEARAYGAWFRYLTSLGNVIVDQPTMQVNATDVERFNSRGRLAEFKVTRTGRIGKRVFP